VRILLVTSTYHGLSQRLQCEMALLNHAVAVAVTRDLVSLQQSVELFAPDLIVVAFFKQQLPEHIYKRYRCLIIDSGCEDNGPTALDWALKRGVTQWSVSVQSAPREASAAYCWGRSEFALRATTKADIFRREITEHATRLVLQALLQIQQRIEPPLTLHPDCSSTVRLSRPLQQEDRRIDWSLDGSDDIVREINAADSFPGVLDEIEGMPVYMYGATRANGLQGEPGELLARSHGSVCRATVDGAVWISQLKPASLGRRTAVKLPATQVLGTQAHMLPELDTDVIGAPDLGCNEIRYYEIGEVGYLHFDFYNGAMNTQQCQRLTNLLRAIKRRPVKVIALMGGEHYWSHGIHLHCIEASADPAEEAWSNVNAMNDLVAEVLEVDRQITVAAVRANAGASGALLAAACDRLWMRDGTVLNAHYQGIGMHGSDYWTYVLPRRVGTACAKRLTEQGLPTLAREARRLGLADRLLPEDWDNYERELDRMLAELAEPSSWRRAVHAKERQRTRDEQRKPLQKYRDEELLQVHRSCFDPDSPFHAARQNIIFSSGLESAVTSDYETMRERRWA
jgi:putative two-component system protein, hydrogenase maturation factor HypX/HoxX